MCMGPKHSSPSTWPSSRLESEFYCANGTSPLLRSGRCRNPRFRLAPIGLVKGRFSIPPSFFEALPNALLEPFEETQGYDAHHRSSLF